MKRIIIATDSFKGSLSSMDVAGTVKQALLRKLHDIETTELYISDGGEGFAHAVTSALHGMTYETDAHDALLRPIKAKFGVVNGNCAVMDVASTVGLTLLRPEELNPMKASSQGAGEMINYIVSSGIHKIIIGLGGSATNDCGKGLLDALSTTKGLDECEFVLASDVSNPLCGPDGATYTFARQKGATDSMLPALEARNYNYGLMLEEKSGRKIMNRQGAGAAGGIGAALMTMNKVRIVNGIDYLLDLYDFDHLVTSASLVITGEGKIDNQTMNGKAPYGIAIRSKRHGVPCVVICGSVGKDFNWTASVWDKIIQVSQPDQSLSEAMRPEIAKSNIMAAIQRTDLHI